MTKKILIGALVAVLVGALAVAAVDLIGGSASAEGGQQHGRSVQQETAGGSGAAENEAGGKGYGRQGQESTQESTADATVGEPGNGQGSGRGAGGQQGQGTVSPDPEPQASVEAWLTYAGTVVASDDQTVTIATDDGQELIVKLGPSWYWQDQNQELRSCPSKGWV